MLAGMLRRIILLAATLVLGLAPALAQAPPPVPALPDTERLTSYSISGSTCACAVNFAIYGDGTDVDAWLQVYVGGTKYLSTDPSHGWTITSATGPLSSIPRPITDAVLTFNSAQTGTVQAVGARRPRRVSQFPENRGVAARDLNQALTDIVAQNREEWDRTNATLGTQFLPPAAGQLLIGQSSSTPPQWETLGGDGSLTAGGALTVGRVNGVSFPASPTVGTIPLVSAPNTVTYSGTTSGNSTVFATVDGTFTNGDCITADSGGNLLDGGAPCVTASAGVSPGVAGQTAFYASSGSTVAGTAILTVTDPTGPVTITSTSGTTALNFNNITVLHNASPAISFTNDLINPQDAAQGHFFIQGLIPTSAGASQANIRLMQFHLQQGYSSSGITSVAEFGNEAGGTGTFNSEDERGNTGLTVYAVNNGGHGGDEIAVYSYAGDTTGKAIALYGRGAINLGTTPAIAIGVYGNIVGSHVGSFGIGGLFTAQPYPDGLGGGTIPTQTENVALVADSVGDTLVEVWRNNNVDLAQFDQNGSLVLGTNLVATGGGAGKGNGTILLNGIWFNRATPGGGNQNGTIDWFSGGSNLLQYVDSSGNLVWGPTIVSNTSGGGNILLGGEGTSLTTGSQNVMIGSSGGGTVTTGLRNITIGFSAGSNLTTSDSNNTIVGRCVATAGQNATVQICDGAGDVAFDYGASNASALTIPGQFFLAALGATPGGKQPVCIDATTHRVYQGSGGAC